MKKIIIVFCLWCLSSCSVANEQSTLTCYADDDVWQSLDDSKTNLLINWLDRFFLTDKKNTIGFACVDKEILYASVFGSRLETGVYAIKLKAPNEALNKIAYGTYLLDTLSDANQRNYLLLKQTSLNKGVGELSYVAVGLYQEYPQTVLFKGQYDGESAGCGRATTLPLTKALLKHNYTLKSINGASSIVIQAGFMDCASKQVTQEEFEFSATTSGLVQQK